MGLVEMGLQENQKLGTAWKIGDAGSHCMRSWRADPNDMKPACLDRAGGGGCERGSKAGTKAGMNSGTGKCLFPWLWGILIAPFGPKYANRIRF